MMEHPIQFRFGVDYYPEHWPESRWTTDARMMREFGLDIVRMGEFSWFKMEPVKGEFHFEWLDRAIDVMQREGLKVILGTPTAAPPAWIIQEDPEIQPLDSQGRVHGFGGRHHDCQSNPNYRAHIKRFVTAYAEHFKDNPAVIGWQVDNELGNSHNDLCHCRHCRARFQAWLKEKYGTIEALNERWGTAFWSQGYQSFDQILTTAMTASGQNPSHALDWKRFCSDLVCEFHAFQADIIRAAMPNAFITHNYMGFADKVNYYDLSRQLDFSSHDQYPGGHFHHPRMQNVLKDAQLSADLSLIRSTKDAPFAIMEQQSSITGWETMGHAPKPGQLSLWSLQCIAHGADAVVYFRWRSCLMGTEQYWHGLLPHSGIPGRNYQELKQFIADIKALMEELAGAMPPREAGILFSYDEEYALQIQPHHPHLWYNDHVMTYYRALHAHNIPTDFIPFDKPLDDYRLIVAPLYFMTTPEMNGRLHEYVANGGTLVLDMRAGVKDFDNLCHADQPLPVGLTDLTGAVVDEYEALVNGSNSVTWDGVSYPIQKWCDIMHTTTAESLAQFEQEFYAGQPAITRNRVGKGTVYYVGTQMGDALALRLVQELQASSQVLSLGNTPEGVEMVCRDKEGARYLFVLNHTGKPVAVPVQQDWTLLTGGKPGELTPYGYQVFKLTIG